MKRKDFLRGLALAGAGAVLPVRRLQADTTNARVGDDALLHGQVDCVLIPQETAGPYPLDRVHFTMSRRS